MRKGDFMKAIVSCGLILVGVIGYVRGRTLAAPLPRFAPVAVEGTIGEIHWVPETRRPGKPGFSGTLGKDRTFPAHFDVELVNYHGPDARTVRSISGFIGHSVKSPSDEDSLPKSVWLRINEPNEKAFVKGMRIRVPAYHVSGDEGGTWSHHDKVIILDKP
jgi:hypothetical protein